MRNHLQLGLDRLRKHVSTTQIWLISTIPVAMIICALSIFAFRVIGDNGLRIVSIVTAGTLSWLLIALYRHQSYILEKQLTLIEKDYEPNILFDGWTVTEGVDVSPILTKRLPNSLSRSSTIRIQLSNIGDGSIKDISYSLHLRNLSDNSNSKIEDVVDSINNRSNYVKYPLFREDFEDPKSFMYEKEEDVQFKSKVGVSGDEPQNMKSWLEENAQEADEIWVILKIHFKAQTDEERTISPFCASYEYTRGVYLNSLLEIKPLQKYDTDEKNLPYLRGVSIFD
jgi:hypothetical protein